MVAGNIAFVRTHRRMPSPDTPLDYRSVGNLRYFVPAFEREFNYTPLGYVLTLRLATSLAEAHVEYLTRFSKGHAVACFFALRRFAEFAEFASAGKNDRTSLQQVKSIYSGTGAHLWRNTVAAYVWKLEMRPISLTTFAEEIGNLFRGLDELASRGLAAKCKRPILPKNYHASGKHRPGLVEQSSKNPVAPQLLAQLEAHIDSLNLPIKGEEADELLRAVDADRKLSHFLV